MKILEDVIYRKGPKDLHWDTYVPDDATGRHPVALLIHGGGWRSGDRKMLSAQAKLLAGLGYVAIVPEYRLLTEAETWPAPLDDVKAAVDAVAKNAASLGVDPDHLFLIGYSAGAQMALLAAAGNKRVKGVAAFYPPTVLGPFYGQVLGLDSSDLTKYSPMTHVASLPPTIIFSGDRDQLVSPDETVAFYNALRKAGRTADLRLYSDLIHEFVGLPGLAQQTLSDTVEFFARNVREKAHFDLKMTELIEWWAKILGAH